ncbi:MAG: WecB/TagA/CpsF family glycosyltransferase [Cephaloticoccus sp.]|nr:WecB/TagA/CpsF family glycosyltransferase [Cephaloticoccus sp.]MCF7760895.1 WecB/TagA/CpsF family glycosyltransferase [Cephaloticoccus sp.]
MPESNLMKPLPRFNVLGVGVSALTLEEATLRVLASRQQKHLGYICICTVHGVSEARRDPALLQTFNASFLTTPDGMPLVWLGRHHGHKTITRVYGPDLMLRVCDEGRAAGLRHYFYGGGPDVAETLRANLVARYPGLQVVGTFTPPYRSLTPAEFSHLQSDVAAKAPDIIWVGLSTPKQERFMAEAWDKLDAALLIGVGAAFDFHSGRLRQAPRWMQRSGLEWLFRLALEPRRLAYRYLVYNPLFVLRTLAQLTGLKRYPFAPPDA